MTPLIPHNTIVQGIFGSTKMDVIVTRRLQPGLETPVCSFLLVSLRDRKKLSSLAPVGAK